jgi:transcription initiation factor TFIIB
MDKKYGFKQGFLVNSSHTEIQFINKTRNIEDGVLKCKIFGCKGKPLIADDVTGEIICGCCGSILVEKSVDVNPERMSDTEDFLAKARTGPEQSLSMYDRGMMTVISNRDALGKSLSGSMKDRFERLKKLNSRSQTRSSSRTLRFTLLFLQSLKSTIGLPESVAESASYIYRKAMQKKITVGRSAKVLMCASVYAACRQNGIPRSINDISRRANISKKEVSRAYRTLIEGLDLTLDQHTATDFVSKIANEAKISEKTSREAIEILQQLTEKRLSDGKNPMVLAASILYLSCILDGEHKTQAEIAKASGTTATALRIRYTALIKELGFGDIP